MTKQGEVVIGVLGGSGIYNMEGLQNEVWQKVESPFGEPSDELLFGQLDGQKMVFLPRHGRGHRLPPDAINYRANIDALKRAGVTDILSISAVGSLRENLAPGTFVLVDQFVDRTRHRVSSFFGAGLVADVSMAKPTCSRMNALLEESLKEENIRHRQGGIYLAMEGPQFSTFAESEIYRSWGCDVIGMTNMPEAKLAREAEICYASVAMVTDYDCWHPAHGEVDVASILEVLKSNGAKARMLLQRVVPKLSSRESDCEVGCHCALEVALITAEEARDPAMVKRLEAVAGRVLG